MALNHKMSNAAASVAADAITPLLDDGYLRIYDGTQPATPDVAITDQLLLAELRYNATAFSAAVNGVATANALTGDSDANATGEATWFRALSSDGIFVVFDGSVGTSNANLLLGTTAIVQHAPVSISTHTYTHKKTQ